MSPTLQKLIDFLSQNQTKQDRIVNGLQAKLDAAIADSEGYKTENEALRSRNQMLEDKIKESSDLEDAVDELIEQYTPVEPDAEVAAGADENDAANPSQAVDELVENIVQNPDIDTDGIDTSTVGTSEPTPPEVVEEVLNAAGEQAQQEIEESDSAAATTATTEPTPAAATANPAATGEPETTQVFGEA